MRTPYVVVLSLAFLLGACGGGGDDVDPAEQLGAVEPEGQVAAENTSVAHKTLGEVLENEPYITDPVDYDGDYARGVEAQHGVSRVAMDGDYWNDRLSLGLCHQAQAFHDTIDAAREVDMLTCVAREFLGDMELTGGEQQLSIDVVDSAAEETVMSSLVQLHYQEDRLEQGILEMARCEDGVQQQYVSHSIAGPMHEGAPLGVYGKYIAEEGESALAHVVAAAGLLKEDRQKIENKYLSFDYVHTGHGNDRFGQVLLGQSIDSVTITASEQGVFHSDQSYRNAQYGTAELLNADDLERIALGHGLAYGQEQGEEFDSEPYADVWNEGWDADTMRAVRAHDMLADGLPANVALPDVMAAPEMGFDANEQMHCTAQPAATIVIEFEDLRAACGQFMVEPRHDFHCHDVVREGNPASSVSRVSAEH